MDPELLESINQKIYSQFPYINNTQPEISLIDADNTLLIYKGEVKTENAFTLPITIRVVVNQSGEIIKITSSR